MQGAVVGAAAGAAAEPLGDCPAAALAMAPGGAAVGTGS